MPTHYMTSPLAGPSVGNMMKVAGNLSTVAAETRQLEARVKVFTDRQAHKMSVLEGEISSVYRRLEDCFQEQHQIATEVRSNQRRLKELEAQVLPRGTCATGTSGPAGNDQGGESSGEEVVRESMPTMNTYSR